MTNFTFAAALKLKLLPAITFNAVDEALPVAEALLSAGLNILEVPFRTVVAHDAIEAIRKTFPEMYVGAGTILKPDQVQKAINSGAHFGLSPGLNQTVSSEATRLGFPFIPGVMTPSEIELAYEMGYTFQKLFPAEQIGGVSFLKALHGPYAHLPVQFIPMGGVNEQNAKAYAQQKNVIALGGSWLATTELIVGKQYRQIRENVSIALTLVN